MLLSMLDLLDARLQPNYKKAIQRARTLDELERIKESMLGDIRRAS